MSTTGQQRATYESHLGRISRGLWRAADAAEGLGDEGAAEDIMAMRDLVHQLLETSVNGKKRKRRQLGLDSVASSTIGPRA
jgi:hypothetical protein